MLVCRPFVGSSVGGLKFYRPESILSACLTAASTLFALETHHVSKGVILFVCFTCPKPDSGLGSVRMPAQRCQRHKRQLTLLLRLIAPSIPDKTPHFLPGNAGYPDPSPHDLCSVYAVHARRAYRTQERSGARVLAGGPRRRENGRGLGWGTRRQAGHHGPGRSSHHHPTGRAGGLLYGGDVLGRGEATCNELMDNTLAREVRAHEDATPHPYRFILHPFHSYVSPRVHPCDSKP